MCGAVAGLREPCPYHEKQGSVARSLLSDVSWVAENGVHAYIPEFGGLLKITIYVSWRYDSIDGALRGGGYRVSP